MEVKTIPIDKIIVKKNIRQDEDEELGDLMGSINRFDILQPILVIPEKGKYRLIAGHRRLKAVKMNGDSHIPALIRDDISEDMIPLVQLSENVQRKQMKPWELVEVFDEMMKKNPGLTKRGIAQLLGKSETWVYFKYKAAERYQELIDAGMDEEEISDISESALIQLSHVDDSNERVQIVLKKGSVSQNSKQSRSYNKKARVKMHEYLGGFEILLHGRMNLLVTCKDEEVKKDILIELHRLKHRRLEEEMKGVKYGTENNGSGSHQADSA